MTGPWRACRACWHFQADETYHVRHMYLNAGQHASKLPRKARQGACKLVKISAFSQVLQDARLTPPHCFTTPAKQNMHTCMRSAFSASF